MIEKGLHFLLLLVSGTGPTHSLLDLEESAFLPSEYHLARSYLAVLKTQVCNLKAV